MMANTSVHWVRLIGSILIGLPVVLLVTGSIASAQELKIGSSGLPRSLDPHIALDTPSSSVRQHLYGSLIELDANGSPQPSLAVSWRPINETTWEFLIRDGIAFHDGSLLTARDVAATLIRVGTPIEGSTSSYKRFVSAIKDVEALDERRLLVTTKDPAPLFPAYLFMVGILKESIAKTYLGKPIHDLNDIIGTGPYRPIEFVPNDRVVLSRWDGFWRERPEWSKVTFKMMQESAARVAAITTGDVDLIDSVSPPDIPRLKGDPNVNIFSRESNRIIYLQLDSFREYTDGIRAHDSSQKIENPFRNPRVRRALSYAMDRKALVHYIMLGVGAPTQQPISQYGSAHIDELAVQDKRLAEAKSLLADAGYPDGFKLTLVGPRGRYSGDVEVTLAVAQMLAKLGLDVDVKILPLPIYATRGNQLEFSIALYGFGGLGDGANIHSLLHTRSEDLRFGSSNRGRYSNPEVDSLIEEAMAEFNSERRTCFFKRAIKISMADAAIIPLFHLESVWATKANLEYLPNAYERTLAMSVRRIESNYPPIVTNEHRTPISGRCLNI